MIDIVKFQEQFGYKFKNRVLLEHALTHPTFAAERSLNYDNQRLEFLGDAVVQITLTRALFEHFPKADEGALTKMRAVLVREHTLAELGRAIGLNEALMMGRGEVAEKGAERDSTLADAFEAFFGAFYLDAGFEAVQQRLLACFEPLFPNLEVVDDLNPKGALQEYVAQHALGQLRYELRAVSGPDHLKHYTVALYLDNVCHAIGEGGRRKSAEADAAAKTLQKLREKG